MEREQYSALRKAHPRKQRESRRPLVGPGQLSLSLYLSLYIHTYLERESGMVVLYACAVDIPGTRGRAAGVAVSHGRNSACRWCAVGRGPGEVAVPTTVGTMVAIFCALLASVDRSTFSLFFFNVHHNNNTLIAHLKARS